MWYRTKQNFSLNLLFIGIGLISTLLLPAKGHTQARFAEICASNHGCYYSPDDRTPDWIEIDLKQTEEAVTLTLQLKTHGKSTSFPFEVKPSTKRLLLLCSDQESERQIPFNLPRQGGRLYIYDHTNAIVDSLTYPALPSNHSWAKHKGKWGISSSPTPGTRNIANNYDAICPPPIPQSLIANTNDPVEPWDMNSTLLADSTFEGKSFRLDSATYYQGKHLQLFWPDKSCLSLDKRIITHHPIPHSSLPTVVLTGKKQDIDGYYGVLGNTQEAKPKRVHFAWFEPLSDKSNFETQCLIQSHGSGKAPDQSFKLLSAKSEGDSPFEYSFFPDQSLDTHFSLVIRNGGQDAVKDGGALLRDALTHELYHNMESSYIGSAHRACHLIINGQYLGIRQLRSHPDTKFIKHQRHSTHLDFLERTAREASTFRIRSGSDSEWNNLVERIQTTPFDNWDEFIHIEQLTDYLLLELWIGNKDWLTNNTLYFKGNTPDSRWEWVLWDTDWGLGLMHDQNELSASPLWNSFNWLLGDSPGWTDDNSGNVLFKTMLSHPSYQKYFTDRAIKRSFGVLQSENWIYALQRNVAQLRPALQQSFAITGGNIQEWEEEVRQITSYIQQRERNFIKHLAKTFDLGPVNTIEISAIPLKSASFKVGSFPERRKKKTSLTLNVPEQPQIEVTIKEAPGRTFICWSDGDQKKTRYITGNTPELSALTLPEALVKDLPKGKTVVETTTRNLKSTLRRSKTKGKFVDWYLVSEDNSAFIGWKNAKTLEISQGFILGIDANKIFLVK